MGIEAAIGAAIVGGLVQTEMGRQAAVAQGRAAEAQLDQAQRERAQEIKLRRESRDAAIKAAEMTPEEIAQINNTIRLNSEDIGRKQRLLDSADPALIEAGKQALELLQGKEAEALSPIRSQRAEQREALKSRLRQQLGAGYETSTAGIQALNDFDRETDLVLGDVQQQTLAGLLGVAQNTLGLASLNQNIAAGFEGARALGSGAGRTVQAIVGTPLTPGTSVTPYAGAPFVQQYGNVQAQMGGLQTAIGLGSTIASYDLASRNLDNQNTLMDIIKSQGPVRTGDQAIQKGSLPRAGG